MKEIMIATSNAHKVEEFREMLEPLGFQVRSLLDLNEQIEIEETGTTFAENAMIKAETVHARLGIPVISDDSGLEVDAMDKAPGVYSARFLGYDTAYEVKNQFIMDQVKDTKNTETAWVENIALQEAMERLGAREKRIIEMRFFQGKTQMEVAKELAISQAQISRIEKMALRSMKSYLSQ